MLGLQLQIMRESIFEDEKKLGEKRKLVKEAKKANPRKIELVCLKNRYGPLDIQCDMLYYPTLDLYQEENAVPFETGKRKRY